MASAYALGCQALAALYPGELPERGGVRIDFAERLDAGVTGVIASVLTLLTGAAQQGGFKGIGGAFVRRELQQFEVALPLSLRFTRIDSGAAVDAAADLSRVPAHPDTSVPLGACLRGEADADARRRFGELLGSNAWRASWSSTGATRRYSGCRLRDVLSPRGHAACVCPCQARVHSWFGGTMPKRFICRYTVARAMPSSTAAAVTFQRWRRSAASSSAASPRGGCVASVAGCMVVGGHELGGQVIGGDRSAIADRQREAQHVAQLAHVAGPAVVEQGMRERGPRLGVGAEFAALRSQQAVDQVVEVTALA